MITDQVAMIDKRTLLLLTLLGLAALLGSACAAAPSEPPQDVVFVIPRGTAAAEMRGDSAFTFPSEINLAVGQAIAIQNEDQAMHYFFYVPVFPGQTIRKTFEHAGAFGYNGVLSCSLAKANSLTIVVGGPGQDR